MIDKYAWAYCMSQILFDKKDKSKVESTTELTIIPNCSPGNNTKKNRQYIFKNGISTYSRPPIQEEAQLVRSNGK